VVLVKLLCTSVRIADLSWRLFVGPASTQGKWAEAQPLFERALEIRERTLGGDDLFSISSLGWAADTYVKLGMLGKAFPLLEKCVSSCERVQGHDHPEVAKALTSLAEVLMLQARSITFCTLREVPHGNRLTLSFHNPGRGQSSYCCAK